MKVLFLTQYDRSGPSSRVRVYQFLPLYQAAGISCTIKPLITGEVKEKLNVLLTSTSFFARAKLCLYILWRFLGRYVDVLSASRYDVVVVQKDVLPFGLNLLLRLVNAQFIYEFDDAIWQPSPNSNERSFILKLIFRYRRHLFHTMLRTARAVIAENSYLAAYARRFSKDVVMMSAPIDTNKYVRQPQPKDKPLVIGWLGTPMTSHLLEALRGPLTKLAKDIPIELHNVAGNPIAFPGVSVKNIPWSEEREVEYLSAFDIGVMPLDDDKFNEGRLGYKMLLYGSMGIPTVADDVGLNREVIEDGINGYLVKGEKQWYDRLFMLARDAALRSRMGAEARPRIARFDIHACARQCLALFARVSESARQESTDAHQAARLHPGKRSKLEAIRAYLKKRPVYEDALDVGVGTGALSAGYHRYARHWVNVEPDAASSALAHELLKEDMHQSIADVKGTYELITLADVFFYFPDPDAAIKELAARLKSNGELLITLTDGDTTLALHGLREWLGLGRSMRGFSFEENVAAVTARLARHGLVEQYRRPFSYLAEELLLLCLDWLSARTKGSHTAGDQFTQTQAVSPFRLRMLRIAAPFLRLVSLLDYPLRPLLRGHRYIAVFAKPSVA